MLQGLDVSNFDIGSLKDMSDMFKGCEYLKTFKGVKALTVRGWINKMKKSK